MDAVGPHHIDAGRRHLLARSAAVLAGVSGLAGATPSSAAGPVDATQGGTASWLIDVTAYGATGDGETDDSLAIRTAITAALARRASGVVQAVVVFPPGTYRVTQPDTLLWSPTDGTSDLVFGLHAMGFGPRVSEIFFDSGAEPTDDPRQNNLITAAVRVRYLQISQMSFRSHNPAQNFAYFWSVDDLDEQSVYPEYGRGQNQNVLLDRVAWIGQWNRVLGIDGDRNANNNSEWHLRACSTMESPTFSDAFLHCGITDPQDHPGQNQFLNFQFEFCHMAIERGVMLRFDRGGSINIVGGSWSMTSSSAGPATYFLFPRSGVDHTASRLLVQGVRFEPKRADHRIVDCAWAGGHVTFVSCTDSSSLQFPEAAAHPLHTFTTEGGRMPIVRYQDCALAGVHTVDGDGASVTRGRLLYDGCRLYHHDDAPTGEAGFLRAAPGVPYVFRDCWNVADTFG